MLLRDEQAALRKRSWCSQRLVEKDPTRAGIDTHPEVRVVFDRDIIGGHRLDGGVAGGDGWPREIDKGTAAASFTPSIESS